MSEQLIASIIVLITVLFTAWQNRKIKTKAAAVEDKVEDVQAKTEDVITKVENGVTSSPQPPHPLH